MLKIIRFDYFPTYSLALFHEICHNFNRKRIRVYTLHNSKKAVTAD